MNRRIATAIVTLALLAITGLPARASAFSAATESDLSSLPQVMDYLRAIGVDPAGVVVQQGQLNYAGPNCPGVEWNCTASNRVVQMAPAHLPAMNVFECLPALSVTLLGLDDCLIVQSSALDPLETASTLNSASCDVESSGNAKQRCKVKQSSKKGSNNARINQRTTQRGGSPQVATQDAEISQTSDTGNNTAKITQNIQQTLDDSQTAAVAQSQNARQYAKVDQTSTTGNNSSDVQQSQSQDENATSAAGITQEQNTDATLMRNSQAEVTQNSSTGNNTSNLRQAIDQDQNANSPSGPVSQTEGNVAGGLQGTVKPMTNAPGVNSSTATQDEPQTQHATTGGTLTQSKQGPEFCCAEEVGGTTANVNLVTQANTQTDDNAVGSSQHSEQSGQCSQTVVGATCTVDQTFTANGNTDHQTMTGMDVNSTRFCNGGIEGGCFGD